MNELTPKDYKYIRSCERKVFDGCNQYELMMKLKPHHMKAIIVGNHSYIVEYIKDKGVGMASGYDRVCLIPLEWVK